MKFPADGQRNGSIPHKTRQTFAGRPADQTGRAVTGLLPESRFIHSDEAAFSMVSTQPVYKA